MALPQLQIPPMNNLRRLRATFSIILGSGSPRRKDLLHRANIPFTIITTDVPEIIPPNEPPNEAAKRLAALKANTIEIIVNTKQPNSPHIIIAADTIVAHNGECLGKPADETEAKTMLCRLRGQTHRVFTAVTLILNDSQSKLFSETDVASTAVTFNNVSDHEIERYIATGDPLDKAGAYGAQELGAFLVDRFEGELDTVIGFPLLLVDDLASKILKRLTHN